VGAVVDRPAGKEAAANGSRILAAAPVSAPSAKQAKPLSALSRNPHHEHERRSSTGAAIMSAESLWAAAGLASATDHATDHDDAVAPIFALDRAREIYLIEHGQIETGAEAALRLP
jgi:hypothetical protein